MIYNTQTFYNSTLAILAGMGAAVLSFVLLPPPSPAFRASRLVALTLRDLRRLAAGRLQADDRDWEGRVYARLSALPLQVEPVQLAQIVTALSVGTEIIRLRRVAGRLDLNRDIDGAFDTLAEGRSTATIERLAAIEQRLGARTAGGSAALRARGSLRSISESLAQHAAYFDSRPPR
jgi:uncharacterized membrane protein YccC